MATTKAILVDITKCIGCRSCEQACKQIHGFPMDSEAKLSPTALTVVEEPRRSLRAAHVHALPGAGLRLSVPGGRAQEDAMPARSLMMRRNASVAATVWWRVPSACRVTSGRSSSLT